MSSMPVTAAARRLRRAAPDAPGVDYGGRGLRRVIARVSVAGAAVLLGGPACDTSAAPGAAPRVELVPVSLPLTGGDDKALKGALQRAAERLLAAPQGRDNAGGGGRPLLLLEFRPNPRAEQPDGRGSEFERALSLARFLVGPGLAGVKTIAFVPETVKGHAALVAIACEELALAPEAEIGEAAADEPADRPIEPFIVEAYGRIAESRRTVPPALARAWVDRSAELYEVESTDRIDLVLAEDLDEFEANHAVVARALLVPPGTLGSQTGRVGRRLGFVKYLADERADLARALRIPPDSLSPVATRDGEWRPVIVDLRGSINPKTVRRINTIVAANIEQRGVNWVGLRIESTGGDLLSCLELAQSLSALDAREVRTVAYVPGEASGGAAIVALACDQLVMHPGARLGGGIKSRQPEGNRRRPVDPLAPQEPDPAKGAGEGAGRVRQGPDGRQPAAPPQRLQARPIREPQGDDIGAAAETIRNTLAEQTDRTASLLTAVIDPELRVFRYSNKRDASVRLFSKEEAASQPDAADWIGGKEITSPGESLRLTAERAEALGVTWRVVQTLDELQQLYGFEGEVRVAKPNWALEFVQALASPQMAMLLLMVAFIGVYVELNLPGVGFGAFIAAVAFVLFFWSKFTAQTADWLEVILFITGLLCILIEVLLLPGVGVFGFGGALLVLASLILASQTFLIPKTDSQLAELRTSLATVAGSFAAMILAGLVMRRYLPHTPLFRKMQLSPPGGADAIDLDVRESVADYAHLVGKVGLATTNLLPSGRAEIEGELIDVIAEGGMIDRGAGVVVVSTRGSRVLVRPATG